VTLKGVQLVHSDGRAMVKACHPHWVDRGHKTSLYKTWIPLLASKMALYKSRHIWSVQKTLHLLTYWRVWSRLPVTI